MNRTITRIIGDVIFLFALFIVPWWVSLVVVCVGILVFNNFYESLFFALLLDGFHGVPGVTFFGTNTFFVSSIGLIFIISIFLKARLKFYA